MHLGRKSTAKSSFLTRTQALALDRQWDWLKKSNSKAVAHTKTADKTFQNFGSTCMLLCGANPHRQGPQQMWQTLCLKKKRETGTPLQEGPGTRNNSFVVVKHWILQF